MEHKKCEAYKQTSEDWYPSLVLDADVKLLRVSLIELLGGGWRVCVWGDDDFGMEKDFDVLPNYCCALESSRMCYYSVMSLEDVTIEELRRLGFVQA